MIKYFTLIFVIIIFSDTAKAQSDASVTWTVSGFPNVSEISLDVSYTSRYLEANGIVALEDGTAISVAGTCFFTAIGGAHCSFLSTPGFMLVFIVDASLNGVLNEYNTNSLTATGVAELKNI